MPFACILKKEFLIILSLKFCTMKIFRMNIIMMMKIIIKIMKISIKTISFYLKQYKKLRPSQKETQEKNHWIKPKAQKMFNYMKYKDPNL